jgi:xanthine dehydrogenase accessory factor
MRTDLLARAETLRRARTPYVLATVVRAERPTSAKAGDSALILADGTLDGFVGGTCAESTVRRQGLRLLRTGTSTLLRITPEPESAPMDSGPAGPAGPDGSAVRPWGDAEGLTVVNNPCLSGGSLEIFLEAMLPAPLIHVHGDAPVARALVRIGTAVGYDLVVAGAGTPIPPDTAAVVVASHGRGEEAALAAAVQAGVPYIALVASRKRGEVVLDSVGVERGRVHTPAGLDIGARGAAEVAVSILAEIIATRPALPPQPDAPPAPISALPGASEQTAEQPAQTRPASAVDPVCGMTVTITPDALTAEHAGQAYYFCGSGCKAAFVDDPHRYLAHG